MPTIEYKFKGVKKCNHPTRANTAQRKYSHVEKQLHQLFSKYLTWIVQTNAYNVVVSSCDTPTDNDYNKIITDLKQHDLISDFMKDKKIGIDKKELTNFLLSDNKKLLYNQYARLKKKYHIIL